MPDDTGSTDSGGGLKGWVRTHHKAAIIIGLGAGGVIIILWIRNRNSSSTPTSAASPGTNAAGGSGIASDTSGGSGLLDTGTGGSGGGGGGGLDTSGLQASIDQLDSTLTSLNSSAPTPDFMGQLPVVTQPVQPTPNPQPVPQSTTGGNMVGHVSDVTFGTTTAQKGPRTHLPTVTTSSGPTYQGIGNEQTARALEHRGFTLYKNVGGQFVEANSARGRASSNRGLYFNPAQSGVKK